MAENAREAALRVLVKIDRDKAYLNLALEEQLKKSEGGTRENALCSRLVIGVVRNRLYLDNIIKNLSNVRLSKISVEILNILRIGVYSVKLSDKIPVSAAVNESVKLAKKFGDARKAGFVNAVLRKAADSGDFLEKLRGNELLSVKYSIPLWLVQKWKREQKDYEELIKAMSLEPKTYCRKNCVAVPEGFKETGITPYTLEYTGEGSVTGSDAYKNGLVTVQDCASQLCVLAMNIQKGQKVLDLCAAPGGKAVFAAYLGAEVTACDLYEHKVKLIEANAKRLNVSIDAKVMDAESYNSGFDSGFDCVLADVPCSGLGIIRRKPDIKWTKTEEDSGTLAKIQQNILLNAARYVKKDGRLVYSTCTVSLAENEGIVKWFLKKNPNFKAAPLNIPFGEKQTQIQLRPDLHPADGFFAAAFTRTE